MAENNLSVNETIVLEEEYGGSVDDICAWIVLVLSWPAFLYGVISWCVLEKFRHYRNYVLVNVMLANGLCYVVYLLSRRFICVNLYDLYHLQLCITITAYTFLFCALAFNCWLFVLCYIFYMDFVKVFNSDIRRRYLKSSLFAWGVPFITVALYVIVRWLLIVYYSIETLTTPIGMSLLLIPVVISLVIYISVVYSLFCSSEAVTATSTNKWHRFYIATLIFMLSDLAVLYSVQEIFGINYQMIVLLIGRSAEVLNTVALVVYFIIVKSNRKVWEEYFKKRSTRATLEMK